MGSGAGVATATGSIVFDVTDWFDDPPRPKNDRRDGGSDSTDGLVDFCNGFDGFVGCSTGGVRKG